MLQSKACLCEAGDMVEMGESAGPRDRNLGPVAALFGEPARVAMLAALADGRALPAALTGRFLTLGWVSRTAGRGLRVAADYDRHLNHWLPPDSVGGGSTSLSR